MRSAALGMLRDREHGDTSLPAVEGFSGKSAGHFPKVHPQLFEPSPMVVNQGTIGERLPVLAEQWARQRCKEDYPVILGEVEKAIRAWSEADRGPHDNTMRLEIGRRVRGLGQQFPRAYARGTATIVEVLEQHRVDSTWEYRVRTDDGKIRQWNMVDTVNEELAALWDSLGVQSGCVA